MNSSVQRLDAVKMIALGFQVMFLILLVASFVGLLSEKDRGSTMNQKDLPLMNIEGLNNVIKISDDEARTTIRRALYNAVVKNSNTFNYRDAKAIVDTDASTSKFFKYQNISFSNILVDIPSIRQMYRIYYEDSEDEDNEYFTTNGRLVIACPSRKENKYDEFDCRLGNDGYEKKIISKYLSYFDFSTFSVSSGSDFNTVYISILRDNETNDAINGYISEVKKAVTELGFDPKIVEYMTIGPGQYSYRNE